MVPATSHLLRLSVTNPLIPLPRPFSFQLQSTSSGTGPTSKVFLLIPDCRFHICIEPVDDPTKLKFPQAVMHTLLTMPGRNMGAFALPFVGLGGSGGMVENAYFPIRLLSTFQDLATVSSCPPVRTSSHSLLRFVLQSKHITGGSLSSSTWKSPCLAAFLESPAP